MNKKYASTINIKIEDTSSVNLGELYKLYNCQTNNTNKTTSHIFKLSTFFFLVGGISANEAESLARELHNLAALATQHGIETPLLASILASNALQKERDGSTA